MRLGDAVTVIDPASPRWGAEGVFVDLTPTGDLRVRFMDGQAETMTPFQVESEPDLIAAALSSALAAAS